MAATRRSAATRSGRRLTRSAGRPPGIARGVSGSSDGPTRSPDAYCPSRTSTCRTAASSCCRRCACNAWAFARLDSASRTSSDGRSPCSNRALTCSVDVPKLSTVASASCSCCSASATANHAFTVWPASDNWAPRRSAARDWKSARAARSPDRRRPHRSASQVRSNDTPKFVLTVLRTWSSAPGIGNPMKFCFRFEPLSPTCRAGSRSAAAIRASADAWSSRAAAACRS